MGFIRKALGKPYLDLIVAALGAFAGFLFMYEPEEARVSVILIPALLAWAALAGIRYIGKNPLNLFG